MWRRGTSARLLTSALSLGFSIRCKMSQVPLPEDDFSLEQANDIFWQSLLEHIRRDFHGRPIDGVLDVGCHHGGMLVQLASAFRPKRLTGIEPISHSRERALFRLRALSPTVSILPPEKWPEVPADSVDIVTCHEVLHLVDDLSNLFGNIVRVLRRKGGVFIVVGCHTENPVWKSWSAKLRSSGQVVFDRSPFDILRAGSAVGLRGALRPLRRDGWIIYDPNDALFEYPSVKDLLDHQYRNKLLFRFFKSS